MGDSKDIRIIHAKFKPGMDVIVDDENEEQDNYSSDSPIVNQHNPFTNIKHKHQHRSTLSSTQLTATESNDTIQFPQANSFSNNADISPHTADKVTSPLNIHL